MKIEYEKRGKKREWKNKENKSRIRIGSRGKENSSSSISFTSLQGRGIKLNNDIQDKFKRQRIE